MSGSARPLRVLVVDDEKSIRITLTAFLTTAGYVSFASHDAPTAIRLVDREKIDIVVSDIVLPQMHGLELLRHVRTEFPETEVILITGEPGTESAIQALRGRAFDYVAKPVLREQFLNVVGNCAKVIRLRKQNTHLLEVNSNYRNKLEELVLSRTAALTTLSRRLIDFQESERASMAREIHDDLGQSLAVLKIHVQSYEARMKSSGEEKKDGREILDLLDSVIEKCRGLAHHLSPIGLQRLGLSRAIGDLAEQSSEMKITVDVDSIESYFPEKWNTNVFRIIQESLANAVKHSGATEVHICAESSPDGFRVVVEDNGKGFSDKRENASAGIGLTLMKERANILGAKLYVTSEAGKGTRIAIVK